MCEAVTLDLEQILSIIEKVNVSFGKWLEGFLSRSIGEAYEKRC